MVSLKNLNIMFSSVVDYRLSTISTLKVLAAWAIGAGPFSYPAEAGLAIGGSASKSYIRIAFEGS